MTRIFLLLLFFYLASTGLGKAIAKGYSIETVQLQKNIVSVEATVLMNEPIRFLAKTDRFLLAASRRGVWISRDGKRFEKLDVFENASLGSDWISQVCPAGDRVLVSIASYPENQRLAEKASPKGGFRKGPLGRGFLFLGEAAQVYKITLDITEISTSHAAELAKYGGLLGIPKVYKDDIQSCYYENGRLYLGSFGSMVELNLETLEVKALERDLELTLNRKAVLHENGNIWTSRDEGGMGGGCLMVRAGEAREFICLLNQNNSRISTNSIFVHRHRIFTSSLAGLVGIDRDNKRFLHYLLSEDPQKMRLYDAFSTGNQIWGVRDDGFAAIDVEAESFTQFTVSDENNEIYGLLEYRGDVYVSNENKLLRIESREIFR